MNTKERLYAVIGGCVGAVVMMVVSSFLPSGAQSQGDNFGEITCTGLKVINPTGRTMVEIAFEETGGTIGIRSNAPGYFPEVRLEVGQDGGHIICYSHSDTLVDVVTSRGNVGMGYGLGNEEGGSIQIGDGLLEKSVIIEGNEHGGYIRLHGKGEDSGRAAMSVTEHGGMVGVAGMGKDPALAYMGFNEHGGGVTVFGSGKNAARARMGVDEHGGTVRVHGKGSQTASAAMGVNEYGNGAVNTWDKNEYRQ